MAAEESNAAVLLNLPEPVGPVAASTTKNDPDDALSVDFGGGYEQGVCRRTGVVDFRSLIQSDAAGYQKHVMDPAALHGYVQLRLGPRRKQMPNEVQRYGPEGKAACCGNCQCG